MAQKTTVTTKSVIDTTSAAAVASNDMTVVTKVIVSKETETAEGTIQSNFIAKTTSVESVVQGAGGQTSSQANQTVQVVENGTAASAGKFNFASYTPNIFLNLRRHTFAGNNLIFRLRTDTLTGSAGDVSSTWTDGSGTSSMVLTSNTATNDLKIVSSNGLKFYELAQAKKIKQAFAITPVKSPSYTVLVFALAKDASPSYTSTYNSMLLQVNAIHKFVESSSVTSGWNDSGFGTKFYNFSPQNYNARNSRATDPLIVKSVFAGSYLNNPSFFARSSNEANGFNISEPNFYWDFNDWVEKSKARYYFTGGTGQRSTSISAETLASSFRNTKIFNLGSTSNSLASAITATPVSIYNGSTTVTYDAFSMFFVEMFAYFNGKVGSYQNKPYEELVFETRINGQLTYSNVIPFNPASNLSTKKTYNIAIGNESANSNADAVPMYLFDYLHGSAFDELSMRKTSKQIIESLAYTYRNLFIKSSSDLQITSSSNAILFPLNISHPFMNVYAKGT
jgi:hypothetical protein